MDIVVTHEQVDGHA